MFQTNQLLQVTILRNDPANRNHFLYDKAKTVTKKRRHNTRVRRHVRYTRGFVKHSREIWSNFSPAYSSQRTNPTSLSSCSCWETKTPCFTLSACWKRICHFCSMTTVICHDDGCSGNSSAPCLLFFDMILSFFFPFYTSEDV